MRVIPLFANAGAIAAGLALGAGLSPAGADEAPEVALTEAGPAEKIEAVPAQAEPAPRDAFAFRRPFIVPVADDWRTQSLVVLSLELTRPEGAPPVTRPQEARMRDRLVAELTRTGAAGAFADPLPDDHGELEAALTAAVMPVMTDAAVRVAAVAKRPV